MDEIRISTGSSSDASVTTIVDTEDDIETNDKTNTGYNSVDQNGISLLDDNKEQAIEVEETKPCSC